MVILSLSHPVVLIVVTVRPISQQDGEGVDSPVGLVIRLAVPYCAQFFVPIRLVVSPPCSLINPLRLRSHPSQCPYSALPRIRL